MATMSGTASIQSVVFNPDGGFDITWAEEADVTDKGTTLHQHTAPGGVVDERYVSNVIDDLRELLDLALIAMRDDPPVRVVHHK